MMTKQEILEYSAMVALSIARAGNVQEEHNAFLRLIAELERAETTCSCGRLKDVIQYCLECDNDE